MSIRASLSGSNSYMTATPPVAAKQPKVWADVGKEQAKITSNFERGVKALHEQAEAVLEELKAREAEERALGKTERHWLSIASSTRSASAASKSLESNGGICLRLHAEVEWPC